MKKLLLKISGLAFLAGLLIKMYKTIIEQRMKLGQSADSMRDMVDANRKKEITNEEIENLSDASLNRRV